MPALPPEVAAEWAAVLAMSRAKPLPAPPDGAVEPGLAELCLSVVGDSGLGASDEMPGPRVATAATDLTALLAAFSAGAIDVQDYLARCIAGLSGDSSGAVLRLIESAPAEAEASAERYRQGTARALEGIPFAVKDIIDVRNTMVTCGSLQTGDRVALTDAIAVSRLRAAGAIPVAMTATTEFACGSPDNRRFGIVTNPWDPTRWTGGSSTGSASAVANGLVPLALATDTGGSIRVPSAWCGVTGFKPTRGLIPRTGVASLSWTLDHVGPIARSARDLSRALPHLWGPDGCDPHTITPPEQQFARPRPLRIGAATGWFADTCEAAVLAATSAALDVFRSAGVTVTALDVGDLTLVHQEAYLLLYCELASLHEESEFDLFDDGTQQRILRGRAAAATDYLRALRRRPELQQRLLTAMADVDVMITPGMPTEAVSAAESHSRTYGDSGSTVHGTQARTTMVFDYAGFPALMLPSGFGAAGLPVAIQVVGRPGADLACLQVGELFQRLTDHHLATPGRR